MKLNRNHIEAVAFIAVYIFALWLWSLPYQNNPVPYGEWDAISHWELPDFMAQRDKTFMDLPPFLDYKYGTDNKYAPHTLWYHPPFHASLAIISVFAMDRMIPIFFTNTVFATAILVSVFFVIRRLYGFLPAILSMFLLSFSRWDIMPFLWGQWPERFAYAFIPIAMYCFYQYYLSYSKESSKPIYLYLMGLILAVNMMIHPLVFFHSLAGIFVLLVGLWIKHRKIPLNVKHIAITLGFFLILFAIFPLQTGNVLVSFQEGSSGGEKAPLSRLLHWAPPAANYQGSVPPTYFDFNIMTGNWAFGGISFNLLFWLVWLGIAALLLRRSNADIFLLSWLVSLYLVLHRDIFGVLEFLHRSLSASSHIFIPLAIVGLFAIPQFLPTSKKIKSFARIGIVVLVLAMGIFVQLPDIKSMMEQVYPSALRINQAEVDVSEWLQANVPEGSNVSIIGPPDSPTQFIQKPSWMASYSHLTSFYFEGFLKWQTFEENREEVIRQHLEQDYIVVDYTDIAQYQDFQPLVQQWQQFEQQQLSNHSLLYNQNNVRVYKYEAS